MTNSITYRADGEAATFTFPFRVFGEGDIAVSVDGAKTSEYTLDIERREITFVNEPPEGAEVKIQRELDYARESAFTTGGIFRAEDINREIDYTRACLQDLLLKVNAALAATSSVQEAADYAADSADAIEAIYDELTNLFGTAGGIDLGHINEPGAGG